MILYTCRSDERAYCFFLFVVIFLSLYMFATPIRYHLLEVLIPPLVNITLLSNHILYIPYFILENNQISPVGVPTSLIVSISIISLKCVMNGNCEEERTRLSNID